MKPARHTSGSVAPAVSMAVVMRRLLRRSRGRPRRGPGCGTRRPAHGIAGVSRTFTRTPLRFFTAFARRRWGGVAGGLEHLGQEQVGADDSRRPHGTCLPSHAVNSAGNARIDGRTPGSSEGKGSRALPVADQWSCRWPVDREGGGRVEQARVRSRPGAGTPRARRPGGPRPRPSGRSPGPDCPGHGDHTHVDHRASQFWSVSSVRNPSRRAHVERVPGTRRRPAPRRSPDQCLNVSLVFSLA